MFNPDPVAHGLMMGRPDNRRYIYDGDRRSMPGDSILMGPDVYGVYWQPVRTYYDPVQDSTLVVFEPVDPDTLPENPIGGV